MIDNIPITDKFWCKCKFDENFNEISYIDNKGNSYEYIDPISGTLLFYKADGIDISQELLDNIQHVKSTDKDEQLFIKCFSNLILISKINKYPNSLFFKNKIDNQVVAEYNMKNRYFFIKYSGIWSVFEDQKLGTYEQIQGFLRSRLEYHLRLASTTPISTLWINFN